MTDNNHHFNKTRSVLLVNAILTSMAVIAAAYYLANNEMAKFGIALAVLVLIMYLYNCFYGHSKTT